MTEPAPGPHRIEQICRSPSEIAEVLRYLQAGNEPILAPLQGGELLFQSRLRLVDPDGSRILLDASPDEAANAALVSRPRCSFFASIRSGHIEFAAAGPQQVDHEGRPAIRLKFPDVLVTRQRREFERATISPQVPLVCLADAGGILSFQGGLVDISVGGLGVLVYDPNITLEPGTVLKGCRIDPGDDSQLVLDLEVRYSEMVSLPDGTRAERSGCRVVERTESLKEFVAALSR
jgi:c-di-GMP-binding flagellar brake protein YcgR